MQLKTFSIETLGCRVNQYEAEQLATLLQSRGLVPVGDGTADLRLVHTCSVTVQAASKSRQTARRIGSADPATARIRLNVLPADPPASEDNPAAGRKTADMPGDETAAVRPGKPRLVLTGCWATSDPAAARGIPGVDAVITHHDDVATELDRLLAAWRGEDERADNTDPSASAQPAATPIVEAAGSDKPAAGTTTDDDSGSTNKTTTAGHTAGNYIGSNKPLRPAGVNGKIELLATLNREVGNGALAAPAALRQGFATLPLLDYSQPGRQRALLKIQDGCDAHCTYCIIPQLRPALWSKSADEAVEEARRLVDAGHIEIVLTGIFLGAYGQPTALRRRQPSSAAGDTPLARLVHALCTRVPGLRRLRLSSLEPGDLSTDLLHVLRSHPQVVPHFHLPLQSGSDRLLRRMNRQYGRDDFLRMADEVRTAFDRPALTTDVIAGFPGEDEAAFADTADVVRRVGFIHIHAFHFSPRPRTAAARWQKDFVRGPVVGDRVDALRAIADDNSLAFRQSFVGEQVELLVENDGRSTAFAGLRHGRCERYFDVWFEAADSKPGDFVRVKVVEATRTRTLGECVQAGMAHQARAGGTSR